jgi:hypothetical protein
MNGVLARQPIGEGRKDDNERQISQAQGEVVSRQGSSPDKNGTGDVLSVSVFGTPIISFISAKR